MEGETTPAAGNAGAPPPVELPAPNGWKKTFIPPKKGTPRRNHIVFVSPTGEEITTKQQLSNYIKSHPGCPSASKFDWGTGSTPRRSTRLQQSTPRRSTRLQKSKAEEAPESEPPSKRRKRLSSKKEAKRKKGVFDGEDETTKETTENKEATTEETKESVDQPMEDAEDGGDHGKGEEVVEDEAIVDNVDETMEKMNEDGLVKEEACVDKSNVDDKKEKTNEDLVVTKEAVADKYNVKDTKEKMDEDEAVKEASLADKDTRERLEKKIEENKNEKTINDKTVNATTTAMEEDAVNKPDPPMLGPEKITEADSKLAEPEALACLPVPGDVTPSSVQEAETGKHGGGADMADVKVGNEPEDANVGQEEKGGVAEAKPDTGCIKDEDKGAGKLTENRSASSEEAPGHELKPTS